jgi:hypothetical protein
MGRNDYSERTDSKEPRVTRGLDGRSGVRNNVPVTGSGMRLPPVLMHFYRLLAVFGILHGPTEFGDFLPERIT